MDSKGVLEIMTETKFYTCTYCGFIVTAEEYDALNHHAIMTLITSPLLDHFAEKHFDGPAMTLGDWLPLSSINKVHKQQ